MAYLLTTTGTLSPVVLDDLGAKTFVHPTVAYDLTSLGEFSEDEIKTSIDTQAALTAGYITITDGSGTPITILADSGAHRHPIGEIDPPPPADVTKFLRGDGTWAVPTGGGGGGYDADQLTYTDTSNKLIGPLPSTPTTIAKVNLLIPTGNTQEYTKDYTVREVTGGSAPEFYICVSTTSTAPGGGSFVGGSSNPATGISDVLSSGDVARVTYPA